VQSTTTGTVLVCSEMGTPQFYQQQPMQSEARFCKYVSKIATAFVMWIQLYL